jgi:hypothetical protein
MMLRLLLDAELDRRIAVGDLHAVSHLSSLHVEKVEPAARKADEQLKVSASLIQSALVFLCQPGMGNDASLSVTYPKFAVALKNCCSDICNETCFFLCLNTALLRHKAKLMKATRDVVVESWLDWLSTEGSILSVGHQYLVRLLNEWSVLGNLLLARDKLTQFSLATVKAVEMSSGNVGSFAECWKSCTPTFAPIKEEYERMLKNLPIAHAEQWKKDVGIADNIEFLEVDATETKTDAAGDVVA